LYDLHVIVINCRKLEITALQSASWFNTTDNVMFHKHTVFPFRKEVDPCFMVHPVKKLVRRQLPYSYLNDVLNQSAHIEPKVRIRSEYLIVNDLKEKIATEFQLLSGI